MTVFATLSFATVILIGCGSQGTPPVDSISPASIAFADALVGSESEGQAVTLSNPGGKPLSVQSISLTGSDAGSFRLTGTCGAVLVTTTSCTVKVVFAPKSTVPARAYLTIVDDAHTAPQAIELRGTGKVNATLNQSSIDFGRVLPGTQTAGRVLVLGNPGQTPMAIQGIALTGAGASSFRLTSECGDTLAGGGSCRIDVAFAPGTSGVAEASVRIESSAANSVLSLPVSGTGDDGAPVDVLVYGATPAGVMAAIEAARLGKQVLVLEASGHVGGMMANGLGSSDLYHGLVQSGLAQQFFAAVDALNGGDSASAGGTNFEPHVAELAFASLLGKYGSVSVFLNRPFRSVEKSGTRLTSVATQDGRRYGAAEFIDASYTGDLMAAAGVSYAVGRESTGEYGEGVAGVGALTQFGNRPVDAYVVPRDPSSGLLPHVTDEVVGDPGTGDGTVMAYNYRLCLSSEAGNQFPIAAPAGYDAAEYELLGRLAETSNPKWSLGDYLNIRPLPHHKFDVNNARWSFSTDEVGLSNGYPEGNAAARGQIEAEEKRYTQGLLYFLTTDARLPADVRATVGGLGYCKDEFTDNGGWPHQLYVREARRMVGSYVMTERDLAGVTPIPDSIGVGGYPVDDHLHHVAVRRGFVVAESSRGYNPNPYEIPYGILVPRAEEVTNLLVPVAVSASHVAYDSLRIETTYMIMGQAAGAGASLAIDGSVPVQGVDAGALQRLLVGEGVVVAP